MTPKRTSIDGLMRWVAVVAIGLVVLRQADAIWASACFTLVLGALGVGAFRAAFDRGRSRTFWAGFSLAGGSYLFVVYGILAGSDQGDPPPLLTRYAMLRILAVVQPESVGFSTWVSPTPVPYPGPQPPSSTQPATFYPANAVASPAIRGPFLVAASDATIAFEQVGQSLIALGLGAVGGRYALRLVATRPAGGAPGRTDDAHRASHRPGSGSPARVDPPTTA